MIKHADNSAIMCVLFIYFYYNLGIHGTRL